MNVAVCARARGCGAGDLLLLAGATPPAAELWRAGACALSQWVGRGVGEGGY